MLELARIFLDKTPKTQEIKAKLDKFNYIELKGYTAKGPSGARRDNHSPGESKHSRASLST